MSVNDCLHLKNVQNDYDSAFETYRNYIVKDANKHASKHFFKYEQPLVLLLIVVGSRVVRYQPRAVS